MTAATVPPFGALRLASPEDIERLGVVAVSGFYYSPIFHWNRPFHDKFPADTLLSYRQKFYRAIEAPECIVLVAVDTYDSEEATKSEAKIPANNGAVTPSDGEEVVVGVASWRLEPGSAYVDLFRNNSCAYPELPKSQNRDMDVAQATRLVEEAFAAQEKYLRGAVNMEMLVVHPAYGRRGHGTRLARWGMGFADMCKVKLGVLAADRGSELYASLGWKEYEKFTIGDDTRTQGLTVHVMEYEPQE